MSRARLHALFRRLAYILLCCVELGLEQGDLALEGIRGLLAGLVLLACVLVFSKLCFGLFEIRLEERVLVCEGSDLLLAGEELLFEALDLGLCLFSALEGCVCLDAERVEFLEREAEGEVVSSVGVSRRPCMVS